MTIPTKWLAVMPARYKPAEPAWPRQARPREPARTAAAPRIKPGRQIVPRESRTDEHRVHHQNHDEQKLPPFPRILFEVKFHPEAKRGVVAPQPQKRFQGAGSGNVR